MKPRGTWMLLPVAFMLASSPAYADEEPATPAEQEPSMVAPWIIGGIGGAALITGGALALAGVVERSRAEDECAPLCSSDVEESIRTKYIAGGIVATAGVVLVTLGAMTYALLETAPVDVAISPDGAYLTLRARF